MRETPAEIKDICFYLQYGEETQLKMLMPETLDPVVLKHLLPLKGKPIENMKDLIGRIRHVENEGISVIIYPDAEEYINRRLIQDRMIDEVAGIRKDPANHPLRKTLLKTELLPYQLDGIAFAAGAGRAVLADDMGLGKTIQGIGLAEFLSRHASVSKVLIICPASLKAQWRIEIKAIQPSQFLPRPGGREGPAGPVRERQLFYGLQLRAGTAGFFIHRKSALGSHHTG